MIIVAFIAAFVILFIVAAILFTRTAKFGRLPSGKRLARVTGSSNYRDGKFQNLAHTPDIAEGVSYFTVMKDFLFNKSKKARPLHILPSVKTDLKSLDRDEDIFVWFGHSGYFMQVGGKRIVVDPVLSGAASPVAFTTRSFKGSDIYSVDDLPAIDYLFITHDHWDHLDYQTVISLEPRVTTIVTSLGVGEHLERWGIDKSKIVELDWWQGTQLPDEIKVTATPARHFSGRGLKRNQSIWSGFVFRAPGRKIFIGGDSGYDNHFMEIGERFGPFDIVILECGQYNEYWKYIHMMPEETVRAAKELHAAYLIPVHWGKFSLALHSWDEPIIRAAKHAEQEHVTLLTPMIGEKLNLTAPAATARWWEGLV